MPWLRCKLCDATPELPSVFDVSPTALGAWVAGHREGHKPEECTFELMPDVDPDGPNTHRARSLLASMGDALTLLRSTIHRLDALTLRGLPSHEEAALAVADAKTIREMADRLIAAAIDVQRRTT